DTGRLRQKSCLHPSSTTRRTTTSSTSTRTPTVTAGWAVPASAARSVLPQRRTNRHKPPSARLRTHGGAQSGGSSPGFGSSIGYVVSPPCSAGGGVLGVDDGVAAGAAAERVLADCPPAERSIAAMNSCAGAGAAGA